MTTISYLVAIGMILIFGCGEETTRQSQNDDRYFSLDSGSDSNRGLGFDSSHDSYSSSDSDSGSGSDRSLESNGSQGSDSGSGTDSDTNAEVITPAPRTGIGINLNFPERGGTFVDVVKENYRWTKDGNSLTASQVDERGWPRVDADFVWDNRPVAEWAGEIDDPEEYRIDVSGTYKCSFKGQAEFSGTVGGRVENQRYDEGTNRSTFDFVVDGPPGSEHGFIVISFRNTRRTADDTNESGFKEFKMHRPGYPLDTEKVFTDEFLAAVNGIKFEALRFMPFVGTNSIEQTYPTVTEWSQRKLIDDASQAQISVIGKHGNAAWELVIVLGNMLKKDIWICIPNSATDEYVRNLAQMIKDNLDPELNIYLENSNEVWNNIFPQQQWNVAQANELGIDEHENHARRTVKLAQIFGDVFGQESINTRVRAILCSHSPMLKWWVVPMLEYVRDNIGMPSDYLYGISSQAYFSIPMEAGQNVDDILSAARANITNQIDELGGENESGRMQWVAAAREWNLPGGYFIYEGGAHPELGNLTNIDRVIEAERDPGMGELLKYNYGPGFLDVGGTLAMHFILSSSYQRYGSFGLTDDIANPDRNFKYGALRDLAEGN